MTPLFKNGPRFGHPIERTKWFFRQCKYTIQRARRGYCDADTWNICDEIIPTLRDMLIQFKAEHNGVPNQYFEQTHDVDEGDKLFCADIQYLIDLAEELCVEDHDKLSHELWQRYYTLRQDVLTPADVVEKAYQDWIDRAHEEIVAKEAQTKEFFAKFGELYNYLWW